MIGKFNSLECLEQGSGLIPNVEPDAFAVAPEFDCTEELRVEIDDTDETRPVRYTSDVRLILHTKDLASRAGLAIASKFVLVTRHRNIPVNREKLTNFRSKRIFTSNIKARTMRMILKIGHSSVRRHKKTN
jgi:hypothetical protein